MTPGADDQSGAGGFRSLRAWQEAIALHAAVLVLVDGFPKEHARLAGQMRDAARSVHANIAEGSGRQSRRDFARFCDQARGSLNEVESDVLMLERSRLASPAQVRDLLDGIRRTGRLLNGLIRHLRGPDA